MRYPIEVLLELFSDSSASGKQYFVYEEYRNKDGEREFYHTNGALWWQWAQAKAIELGGPGTGVCSIVFSIDATFAKKNTYSDHYTVSYCIEQVPSFQFVRIISYVFRIVEIYFVCFSYLRHLFRMYFVL